MTSPNSRLGVLAFGDSITNGGGELQWGVALQSWALWVARGLGLAYTGFATDGAAIEDVVDNQTDATVRRSAHREARYDVGCLYIGVNDVRAADWDPVRFERGYRVALRFLVARCDRVLAVTAPLDLGRPRAGAKVDDLDAIITRQAADHGALLLDLRDFGGRNLVMTDHVHPTAFGQIVIAERALDVLQAAGIPVLVRPRSLIRYETTWWQRLRSDATYAYRALKVSLRTAVRELWLSLASAPPPPSPRAGAGPAPR
jgi:lysophospholipase L1-like esterase